MLTEYKIGADTTVKMGLVGRSQRFFFERDGHVFGMCLSMYEVAELVKELNRYMKWNTYHPVKWERDNVFYDMHLLEVDGKIRVQFSSVENSTLHNFQEFWFDITIAELTEWLLQIVRFKWEDAGKNNTGDETGEVETGDTNGEN